MSPGWQALRDYGNLLDSVWSGLGRIVLFGGTDVLHLCLGFGAMTWLMELFVWIMYHPDRRAGR